MEAQSPRRDNPFPRQPRHRNRGSNPGLPSLQPPAFSSPARTTPSFPERTPPL